MTIEWEQLLRDHASLTIQCFEKGDFSDLFKRFPIPKRQVREKHSGAIIENFNFGTSTLKPSEHTVTYVIAAASNVDATVQEKLKSIGTKRTTDHKENAGIMENRANIIKADAEAGENDMEDWEKDIRADETRAIEEDKKAIKAATEQVIAEIKNNVPKESRKDAADFWIGISQTITGIVDEVWKAIKSAFDDVIAWIKDVWEKVKQVFADIGNWFAQLFETIKTA